MRTVLSLVKPRYHLSYAAVVAAALLFGHRSTACSSRA